MAGSVQGSGLRNGAAPMCPNKGLGFRGLGFNQNKEDTIFLPYSLGAIKVMQDLDQQQ